MNLNPLRLYFLVVLMFSLSSCIDNRNIEIANESTISTRSDSRSGFSYEYPVKPGTSEWYDLSHDERINVCQIPDNILVSMPSSALAISCVEHPLVLEYVFANNEKEHITLCMNEFNCLTELLRREDGVRNLMNVYDGLIIDSDVEYPSIKLGFLELFLSDEKTLSSLNDSLLDELQETAKRKLDYKIGNAEEFAGFSIRRAMMLNVSVLLKKGMVAEEKSLDLCRAFLEDYLFFTDEYAAQVLQLITNLN